MKLCNVLFLSIWYVNKHKMIDQYHKPSHNGTNNDSWKPSRYYSKNKINLADLRLALKFFHSSHKDKCLLEDYFVQILFISKSVRICLFII